MTSSSLLPLICRLTHQVDSLEQLMGHIVVCSANASDTSASLTWEIGMLHGLIDDLNALYEETKDREMDAAFEGATH